MPGSPSPQSGIKLGVIAVVAVTIGFALLFVFGPASTTNSDQTAEPTSSFRVTEVLDDAETRAALAALAKVAPATLAELNTAAAFARAEGADQQTVAQLTLEALFSQFQDQALALRSARSEDYQAIIAGFASGLSELKANQSPWCEGPTIAAYLTQNDDRLVPSLLQEFPYGSPQYAWAMRWMTTILQAVETGKANPNRHPRPGFRDETILQQEGLALGSEQWALALQIAAFANAEGTSYAQMQDVIAGMDVCDLGVAIETVSGRLPTDVRARIWGDLMPEIMVGNTPYVIWRVTDYFFIG